MPEGPSDPVGRQKTFGQELPVLVPQALGLPSPAKAPTSFLIGIRRDTRQAAKVVERGYLPRRILSAARLGRHFIGCENALNCSVACLLIEDLEPASFVLCASVVVDAINS